MKRTPYHPPDTFGGPFTQAEDRVGRAQVLVRVYRNATWTVNAHEPGDDGVTCLAIRRLDGATVRDWRQLQRIKNEVCGQEREAFELFPAESRLVDTCNNTYLWVLPAGVRLPWGHVERMVCAGGRVGDMVQSPFAEGTEPPDAQNLPELLRTRYAGFVPNTKANRR